MRTPQSLLVLAAAPLLAMSPLCTAETVRFERDALTVSPGDSFSLLVLLEDSTTPLFGYSLGIGVADAGGSTGGLSADVARTNFFDSRNLITAGGGVRDPFFSVILPSGDGVFISTNSDDGSGFTASPGLNDVLAEVFFTVSGDAAGEFSINFGPGTALADTLGFPVPFTALSTIVTVESGMVIPLPSAGALAGLGLCGAFARVAARRRRAVASSCGAFPAL